MPLKTQLLVIAVCFLTLVVGETEARVPDDAALKVHFQKIRQVVLCKYYGSFIYLFSLVINVRSICFDIC